MVRPRRLATTAFLTALLLVSATAGVGASAVGGDNAVAGAVDDDRVDSPTQCFAGDGYPISIGESGATIDAVIHLSVLTDPAVGNEFGLEAAGSIGDDPVVTLAAGVRLTAREAIADGIDPFAAFDVLYTYELRLPMFDGAIDDPQYSDEGSPITSAAGAVPC